MSAPFRLLFATLALAIACESSSPPTPTPTTTPAPAPADPAAAATPSARDSRDTPLPSAAGIHYLELVTGGADPNAELPMIVAIHGLGDDPHGFADLFADFDTPARIILPRALDEHEPGYSWFPIRAASPDQESLANGISRAADAIAAAVEELVQTRPTRGKPIVTGFSQGGMLTFTLATTHPEQFGAAIAVGGWLPPPLWPPSNGTSRTFPPLVALHGDADNAVQIGPTRESVEYLQTLGMEARLHVYPGVGHSIPPEMHQELLRLLAASLSTTGELPRAP